MPMHGDPPAHHVAVRDHDLRQVDIERAIAKLIQVQHIRLRLANHA